MVYQFIVSLCNQKPSPPRECGIWPFGKPMADFCFLWNRLIVVFNAVSLINKRAINWTRNVQIVLQGFHGKPKYNEVKIQTDYCADGSVGFVSLPFIRLLCALSPVFLEGIPLTTIIGWTNGDAVGGVEH